MHVGYATFSSVLTVMFNKHACVSTSKLLKMYKSLTQMIGHSSSKVSICVTEPIHQHKDIDASQRTLPSNKYEAESSK